MERTDRPIVDLLARCACGAVTLHLRGKVRAMFMCACEDCQKATGTGHSAVLLVHAADVTVGGETRAFARPANSGATFTNRFCPHCGTPLHGRSSRAPELLLLPVGLFGAAASWFVPSQMIFARSHRDWDTVAAGLPMYRTYRDEEPRT